jgi:hypothetical protein
MARECIDYCPRIKEIVQDTDNRNLFAGPMAIHPDYLVGSNTERLLEVCNETYDCPGPQVKEVEVQKGFIKKRIETEVQVFCGLDQSSS